MTTAARLPVALTEAQHREVERILARCLPGREVRIFGSRASGTAKPFSDLDLAIMGDEPLDLATLALLREAFSESDLPWKVDLVDWAAASEAFRAEIAARWLPLPVQGR